MAEVRYYGLGILAHINNTKKGRVDDHFDINSVLFLFREPDIFLLTRYSPFSFLCDKKFRLFQPADRFFDRLLVLHEGDPHEASAFRAKRLARRHDDAGFF